MSILPSLDTVLDFIFDKNCVVCKALVSENFKLCNDCWDQLELISSPKCPYCSQPFATSAHLNLTCDCRQHQHLYTSVQSLVEYNDMAKHLILSLKNKQKFRSARFMAGMMAQQYYKDLYDVDYICPAPMHSSKLRKRGYNQIAIILRNMSAFKAKIKLDLLVKNRKTANQSSLSRKERMLNLKDAFAINTKYINDIDGKTVAIFDDVVTTGSTLNECTKALLESGAKDVKCFTFAKTKRSQ